jgi:hypothetical protein
MQYHHTPSYFIALRQQQQQQQRDANSRRPDGPDPGREGLDPGRRDPGRSNGEADVNTSDRVVEARGGIITADQSVTILRRDDSTGRRSTAAGLTGQRAHGEEEILAGGVTGGRTFGQEERLTRVTSQRNIGPEEKKIAGVTGQRSHGQEQTSVAGWRAPRGEFSSGPASKQPSDLSREVFKKDKSESGGTFSKLLQGGQQHFTETSSCHSWEIETEARVGFGKYSEKNNLQSSIQPGSSAAVPSVALHQALADDSARRHSIADKYVSGAIAREQPVAGQPIADVSARALSVADQTCSSGSTRGHSAAVPSTRGIFTRGHSLADQALGDSSATVSVADQTLSGDSVRGETSEEASTTYRKEISFAFVILVF